MKVVIVLPAYNAERTLESTINDIPLECVDELILVDDCSRDNTFALANAMISTHSQLSDVQAPGKVVLITERLAKNRGYGGNQKRCYDLALERGADIVVMLHPDYQYDPKLIRYFVELIKDNYFDVMLGSRIRSRAEARAGGMPAYKYYANRLLTLMANVVTGRNLSEWHTGMRAYRSEVLKRVPYKEFSDDFIFDAQMLFAISERSFTIGDISVPVRYFEDASSINFKRSVRYGLLNLWEMLRYSTRRMYRNRLLRYLVAGATSAGVNLVGYTLLISFSDMWYVIAALLSFLLGAVVSFTLQKFWTFNEPTIGRIPGQLVQYLLIVTFNVAVNIAFLATLVEVFGFNKLIAAFVSTGAISLWSFFMYRRLVFTIPDNRPLTL